MPDPRPQHRRTIAATLAVVVAACAIAVGALTPIAAGRTVEFTSTAGEGGIDLGTNGPVGATGTIKFRVNRADRRALAAAKRQQQLLAKADEHSAAAATADQRIAAIQQLLLDVQDDQARLEDELRSRMVARYKDGEGGDLAFLLGGDGLSDLVTRSEVLKDQSARDRRTIHDYEVTVARVELYEQVLEELRDINGSQARTLRDRADRLDDVLVAARTSHDEQLEDEASDEQPKGVKGTWYVMDGAFTAQLFLPNAGSGWGGGWRTPARKATPQQIQRVLQDPRIDLDASGYQDVITGQIDGRLLDAMLAAAERFNYLRITSLKSDHGVYTASGNVSEHSFGCAMDIGTIGNTLITPSSQTPGSEVEQAVLFFNGLAQLTGKPDLAPHQVISLFDLGGATMAMGDHGDHIHVGYAC